ncbi:hypothetical protein FACS1894216_06510 [Synergistales bacterium]|nr:hypothetical protein FACS1894216_06510 [Synergistales bacterium]
MFLFPEEGGAVALEGVLALVKRGGHTEIIMRDGSTRLTPHAPFTLEKSAARFFERSNVKF